MSPSGSPYQPSYNTLWACLNSMLHSQELQGKPRVARTQMLEETDQHLVMLVISGAPFSELCFGAPVLFVDERDLDGIA